MKKVLYVITKSNWGGAQRYVFDLATNLPKEDFDVAVALGGTGGSGAEKGLLAERLEGAGVRTIFVDSFMRDVSFFKEWRAFTELLTLFKKERPDVVHLNSSKAGAIGALAARLSGIKKIVFTTHGLAWQEDRNPLILFLIYLASLSTFLLCHKVITITEGNYTVARKQPFCKKKVTLVHNGIAPGAYLSKDEAREKLGLPKEAFIIGGIGELTWNKGWHFLLRAASTLKHHGTSATVAIVGGGEEKDFLTTVSEEQDIASSTSFAGFVPDASRCVRAFDIFVLPSLKEGLPYVLLEAGQARVPIIATTVGGIGDIIGNKISGLLVKPKDAGGLADALLKMSGNLELREHYAEALHSHIMEEFTLTKMMISTARLY